ncbi:hypothetical protein A2U01_0050212, partial [Trifolium medium]|nr:hypothetical protein [Trifolium medium]
SPDSRYPAHDSDAPAVSWSVSGNAPSGQSAGGTAGSMKESEYVQCNPGWQSSVGEKSVVVPSSSCSAAHIVSQPSPAQNLNTGTVKGCEVEPDAAPAVVLVVAVVLLPGMPLNLSPPSGSMCDQGASLG